MSMHIDATVGDIAPRILLCGDPLRAKAVAEQYLENPVCYSQLRGMLGYTGTWKGQPISAMGVGMGIPSMMIYATELCSEYGCKKLVRMGTGSSFKEEIQLGDIIISQAASTNSAVNDHIFPGHYSPVADFDLLMRSWQLAKERGIPAYVGNTMCNDLLYIDNKLEYSKIWSRYGVLGSEMEAAALYTAASRYGGKALTIFSVVINLYRPEEELPEQLSMKKQEDMVLLALDTLLD